MEQRGLLKLICSYPESAGLEDHLQIIKSEISEFNSNSESPICFVLLYLLFLGLIIKKLIPINLQDLLYTIKIFLTRLKTRLY